jgi:hypothetical protein
MNYKPTSKDLDKILFTESEGRPEKNSGTGRVTSAKLDQIIEEDWGSSDWSAAINMMEKEMDRLGGVNPENIETAAMSVAEHYFDMMGYDRAEDAVGRIIDMYMTRSGFRALLSPKEK